MRAMRLLSLFALLSFAVVVSGCNTVEGFGRDLERGGEKLQDEAREERIEDEWDDAFDD